MKFSTIFGGSTTRFRFLSGKSPGIFLLFAAIVVSACLLFPAGTFTASATSAAHPFDDVFENHPVNEALSYLYGEDVIEGYSDGTFRTESFINRAEFVKMIVAGMGLDPDEDEFKSCFDDVADEWYARYVCYSAEEDWVEGYGDGRFRPAANITKTEALAVIERVLDWDTEAAALSTDFSDVSRSDWFAPYVATAQEAGMLIEVNGWLSPHEIISRGQMSEYLYRALLADDGDAVTAEEYDADLTYEEVLATGIQAAIPADFDFPARSQTGHPYACYGFSMINLMTYEFTEGGLSDLVIGIENLKSTIGWDGSWMWSADEFAAFTETFSVDVIFNYNASADFFFRKLAWGVPMIVAVPYYIDGENVWHDVVAYSFDEDGVWVADSDGGYTHQIDFDEVFFEDDSSTNNLTEFRKVKDGGAKRDMVWGY